MNHTPLDRGGQVAGPAARLPLLDSGRFWDRERACAIRPRSSGRGRAQLTDSGRRARAPHGSEARLPVRVRRRVAPAPGREPACRPARLPRARRGRRHRPTAVPGPRRRRLVRRPSASRSTAAAVTTTGSPTLHDSGRTRCRRRPSAVGPPASSERCAGRRLLAAFNLVGVVDAREVVDGGVAGCERREVPPVLDRGQDRGCVVGGGVHHLVAAQPG